MIHAEVHEIGDFFSTSSDVEIGFLVKSEISKDFIIPIYIGVNIWVQSLGHSIHLLLREKHRSRTLVGNRLIVHLHISNSIYKFRNFRWLVNVCFYTKTNDRFLKIGTRFCLDNHNAIGSTCTIHGSGCSIFQNRKTFNDFRINSVQVGR